MKTISRTVVLECLVVLALVGGVTLLLLCRADGPFESKSGFGAGWFLCWAGCWGVFAQAGSD